MGVFEIGLVLSTWRSTTDGATVRWTELRDMAVRAEAIGFDTVWSPDELLGRAARDGQTSGFWDGVAITAALATATSRIRVGSWVLSSLHRNPGITAKAAATIDEISGGRFILGLGAGHPGPGTQAMGLPETQIHARFEEALQIIVPLLRDGRSDFEGTYYVARDLVQSPAGPRPDRIPLMLAAQGPKGYRHAARVADIWCCYAERASDVAELGPRVVEFEAVCDGVGRDPSTIGRSAGIVVAPLESGAADGRFGAMVTGGAEQIADAFRSFRSAGFSRLEVTLHPQSAATLEAMAPVLDLLHGD